LSTFDCLNINTLFRECDRHFKGIAFDGCFYYLTDPQAFTICKLDDKFEPLDCFCTDKPFAGITYDSIDRVFWAFAENQSDTVYKLDRDLEEISAVRLCGCSCGRITGISFDCRSDTLLVSSADAVYEIIKDGRCRRLLKEPEQCEGEFVSVASMPPYFAVIRRDRGVEKIIIYSGCLCVAQCITLPPELSVKDFFLNPCRSSRRLNSCDVESSGCEACETAEFILLASDGDCDSIIISLKAELCGIFLSDCVFKICGKKCKREEKEEKCSRCKCSLICSVALVEASLAHILNAEGEKLQKAVKIAGCVDELLEVNRSVADTINRVTLLENVLLAKLNAIVHAEFGECAEFDKTAANDIL